MTETRSMRKRRKTTRMTLNLLDLPNEILGRIAQYAVESEYDTGRYHAGTLQYQARVFRLRLVHPIFAAITLPHILRRVWCTYEVRTTAVPDSPGSYVPCWKDIVKLARQFDALHHIVELDLLCAHDMDPPDPATILTAVAAAPRLEKLSMRGYGSLKEMATRNVMVHGFGKTPSLMVSASLPAMPPIHTLILDDARRLSMFELLAALLPAFPLTEHVEVCDALYEDADRRLVIPEPSSATIKLASLRMGAWYFPDEHFPAFLRSTKLRPAYLALSFSCVGESIDFRGFGLWFVQHLASTKILERATAVHIVLEDVEFAADTLDQVMVALQLRIATKGIAVTHEHKSTY